MTASQYRKIELQSPADLAYLYTNTVALSRQKLDLHLPPSANDNNNNDPNTRDSMKERVKELVDEVWIESNPKFPSFDRLINPVNSY
jgi:kinetochor protein Mis14/NSL1